MKTRIRAHEIRLRLTQTEVARLRAGDGVDDVVPVGSDCVWRLGVRRGDALALTTENGFQLVVPGGLVDHWAANDEEGFDVEIGPTRFSIEKDFACKRPRPDETDTFPNPNNETC